MKIKTAELAVITAAMWAAMFLLAYALTVGLSHHGPTGFLAALYGGCTGMMAASWAAGVAVPIGVRHG